LWQPAACSGHIAHKNAPSQPGISCVVALWQVQTYWHVLMSLTEEHQCALGKPSDFRQQRVASHMPNHDAYLCKKNTLASRFAIMLAV
jgi:hypothetical protein